MFPKVGHRLLANHGESLYRGPLFRKRLHPFFNSAQIILCKTRAVGEIVIETIFNHGADGDLRLRKQLLDRLSEQMGTGMADDLESFGIFCRNDAQICVFLNPVRGVDQTPVDLTA